MTLSFYTRSGLAVVLTAAMSSSAMAGSESVDPNGPVFVPQVFSAPVFVPPVFSAPTPSSRQPSSTAGEPGIGGSGGAAASASDAARAEQQAQQTARATQAFNEAQVICVRISDTAYGIDCLADQLAQYAAALPQDAEYDEVRQIVDQTADRLKTVARRNASTTKRPARLREATGSNPKTSSRPIVPVAPERQQAANELAISVLREAETRLLRAAESSERRKVAFSQVAEAVGTSTILLRST